MTRIRWRRGLTVCMLNFGCGGLILCKNKKIGSKRRRNARSECDGMLLELQFTS